VPNVVSCLKSHADGVSYNNEFDYDHIWFAFISISEPERILNFFIVSQFVVSTFLTGQTGVFPVIGWAWYGFWTLFGLPTWWTFAFLLRPG